MTTMYYVSTVTDDDASIALDLFVEANSTDEAAALWRAYYADGWDALTLDECTLTIWPLPATTGKPRAVAWFTDIAPAARVPAATEEA